MVAAQGMASDSSSGGTTKRCMWLFIKEEVKTRACSAGVLWKIL